MGVISIRDNGDGWRCYADWHGQERIVFQPFSIHPGTALIQCLNFRRDHE